MQDDTQQNRPDSHGDDSAIAGQFLIGNHHDKDDTGQSSRPEPADKQQRVISESASQQTEINGQHAYHSQAEYRI